MFGFVRPNVAELKICEMQLYRAIYCGICQQLGKQFGCISKIAVNYDVVLLFLFLLNLDEEELKFEKKFCAIHPTKKVVYLTNCSHLNLAARISLAGICSKVRDNIMDEKKIKKWIFVVVNVLLKKSYNKLLVNSNRLVEIFNELIENQQKIEQEKFSSIDLCCHETANCFGKIYQLALDGNGNEKLNHRLGYLIGRFVFLMDALADVVKDCQKNRFNPFLKHFSIQTSNKNLTYDQKQKIKQLGENLINLTIGQLIEIVDKFKFKRYDAMIKNIVNLGLAQELKKTLTKLNDK